MGLGTGFAHAFLGSITARMQPEEAIKFRLNSLVLSKMGHIGIALLLISGLYLVTPFWKVLPSYPLLVLKFALVIVLIILISLIGIAAKKAKNGDAARQLEKMGQLGKLTLLTGIAIVVIAVFIFH